MTPIHFQINSDNTFLSDWRELNLAIFVDGTVNPFSYKVDAINLDTDCHVEYTMWDMHIDEIKKQIQNYGK